MKRGWEVKLSFFLYNREEDDVDEPPYSLKNFSFPCVGSHFDVCNFRFLLEYTVANEKHLFQRMHLCVRPGRATTLLATPQNLKATKIIRKKTLFRNIKPTSKLKVQIYPSVARNQQQQQKLKVKKKCLETFLCKKKV